MSTTTKLYKGEVTLAFNSDSHIYYAENKRSASVTQILDTIAKPALIPWASKMAIQYVSARIMPGVPYDELALQDIFLHGKDAHKYNLAAAGGAGTLVHNWVERYIKRENPDMPESKELQKSVNKFLKWTEEFSVEFLASEVKIYSVKHGYAGTLDFICKINGKLYIGDLKTSNGMYHTTMGAQVAAYKMAREEEFENEKYAGCIVLRVSKKDAQFDEWKIDNIEPFENVFLHALKLYESINIIKQKEREGRF